MTIYHSNIITCDDSNNQYSYLVEDQGKILFTGNSLPAEFKSPSIVELGKKALLPAFGDGHMHFSSFSLLNPLDIRKAQSISEQIDLISNYINQNPKQKIYICFGFSTHNIKEKRLMLREELDKAATDKPVIIVVYDCHSAICNSKMINEFPQAIKQLRGFDLEKGHLFNEAFLQGVSYATKKVPLLQLIRSSLNGLNQLAKMGIGMAHIVKNKIADIVILNQNPLDMNKKDLRQLKVESVLYSGKPSQEQKGILPMLINGLTGKQWF